MLLVDPAFAAPALTPATAEAVQVEAGVRYATGLGSSEYDLWGVGYGGALGYTLKNGLYLGGSFDHYNGEEYSYRPADPSSPKVGGNYWQALVQAGYDRPLSKRWIWRPKVGVGWATLNLHDCIPAIEQNRYECAKFISSNTAIVPAVQLMFVSHLTFSLEARYVMLFDSVTIKHAVLGGANIGF
jgi:hypothetical protein